VTLASALVWSRYEVNAVLVVPISAVPDMELSKKTGEDGWVYPVALTVKFRVSVPPLVLVILTFDKSRIEGLPPGVLVVSTVAENLKLPTVTFKLAV
jgi:hypothetical protein